MSKVAELMKRCQRGVGGRNALDEAHDIMAECYGTLGRLESERDTLRQQRDKLAGLLRHASSVLGSQGWDALTHEIDDFLSELTP